MITLSKGGAYLIGGTEVVETGAGSEELLKNKLGDKYLTKEDAAKNTMAYGILNEFDKLTSHDITFVGIIQTARASGLEKFPIPYVLTNCHNSLCAVGGTINEDDHMFGLTCAKKYGGIYVPPHQAVIHQFAREMLAGGGKMIPEIVEAVKNKATDVQAYVVDDDKNVKPFTLKLGEMTDDERDIILKGCLINYNRK